jgi:hypothetical protein
MAREGAQAYGDIMQNEELYQKLIADLPRDGLGFSDAGKRFRRYIVDRSHGHACTAMQCSNFFTAESFD